MAEQNNILADGTNLDELSFSEIRKYYNRIPQTGANLKRIQRVEDFTEAKFGVDLFRGQTPSEELTSSEKLTDIGMSAASGGLKGTTGAIDAPNALLEAGSAGLGYLMGGDKEAIRQSALEQLGNIPVVGGYIKDYVGDANATAAAEKLAPELMGYEPKTGTGEAVQRVTEFVPFAGKKVISQAIAPALASLYAGKIEGVEGTSLQLPVEIATAVLTPVLAKKIVSPRGGELKGVTKEYLDTLKKEGIVPSAGTMYDDDVIKAWEEATRAGRDLQMTAFEQFSRAALKRIGVNGSRATPKELERVYNEMKTSFENTIGSIDTTARKIVPSSKQMDEVVDILGTYGGQVNPSNAAPIFRNLYNAFQASAKSGQSLSKTQIKRFHDTLNAMTRRGDVDGQFAREILPIVKQMVDSNLTKEARDAWRSTNGRYRDFLAIEKTLKSGEGLYEGLVTPNKLASATQQVFKRSNLFGKSDLGQLAKAGGALMKRLPQSGTGPRLQAAGGPASQDATRFGAAGFGYTGDPQTAAAAAALGTIVPPIRNQFISSPAGQAYLKNQLIDEFRTPETLLRMLGASTLPQ